MNDDLASCVDFLGVWLNRVCDEPQFPVDDLAREIGEVRRDLHRWHPDHGANAGWRIPCPTLLPDGNDCAQPLLVIDLDGGTVHCRACGRDWQPRRLVHVAGRDADVWVDPEAAAEWTDVHPATLRKWAAAGRIARSHGRYSIKSIRDAIAEGTKSQDA